MSTCSNPCIYMDYGCWDSLNSRLGLCITTQVRVRDRGLGLSGPIDWTLVLSVTKAPLKAVCICICICISETLQSTADVQGRHMYIWDTSVDGWCTRTSSPVCFDVDTRRTTSSHHWWSCVSGCCVACLEFSSNFGQGNPVTACVAPEIEDGTVCHLFSGRLTVI